MIFWVAEMDNSSVAETDDTKATKPECLQQTVVEPSTQETVIEPEVKRSLLFFSCQLTPSVPSPLSSWPSCHFPLPS